MREGNMELAPVAASDYPNCDKGHNYREFCTLSSLTKQQIVMARAEAFCDFENACLGNLHHFRPSNDMLLHDGSHDETNNVDDFSPSEKMVQYCRGLVDMIHLYISKKPLKKRASAPSAEPSKCITSARLLGEETALEILRNKNNKSQSKAMHIVYTWSYCVEILRLASENNIESR